MTRLRPFLLLLVLGSLTVQSSQHSLLLVNGVYDPLKPGGQFLTMDVTDEPVAPLVRVYDPDQRRKAGQAIYYRDWLTSSGNEAPLAGPDYDATSCAACHAETAPSQAFMASQHTPLIAKPVTPAHEARVGAQVNVRHHEAGKAEATVDVVHVERSFTYPDGESITLSRPVGRARDVDGRLHPVRLRTAPLLFGWGLLENVDASVVRYFDDPADANGDGISGRQVRLAEPDSDGPGFGLLGWKSTHGSLRAQIASALANDMGVVSSETCDAPDCSVEVPERDLDALAEFVRGLTVPNHRRDGEQRGQNLFGTTGCSNCHVSVLKTRPHPSHELSEQLVWAYSDLMLHDMGTELAEAGSADDSSEWRTAPLWGVGYVERHLPEHGFLHDGRARNLEEAVLWHGGEAADARQRFVALEKSDREALLRYLRSL